MATGIPQQHSDRRVVPFVREAGAGPGVVCLHANASTSGQWRGLLDRLATTFHAFAPDAYDAGGSPEWGSDRIIRLQDEVDLIEPVLAAAGSPLRLVGHSYGGAIALMTALANPSSVRSLVLYEPTLFSLIDAERAAPNDADGIREVVAASARALDQHDRNRAAEIFIDYWMGEGTWRRTPTQRQAPIAASITNVRRWGHALFTEPTPLERFRTLTMPILYMVGTRSTPAALGVARLLTAALPRVEVMTFEQLGHMGPVTHSDAVNATIEQFLARHG
jgi:pimeloyl-ACP methyl ester carboxylesterase